MIIILLITGILIKAQDALGNDISGDNQIGEVNEFLKRPIVVRALDSNKNPRPNVLVMFSLLYEPEENILSKRFAELEPDTVKTDKDGYAKVWVKLGGAKGKYFILAKCEGESLIFSQVGLEKNWFLFILLSIIGGLALFIFGLNYGSKGLIRMAGSKMRDVLFTITKNRIFALITGIFITIILGSSTAASVLLVRFASLGIISLVPALGILLGADIGTTIVVQLLAFKISDYAILIVAVGVFLRLLFPGLRNIAQFIFGIGLLFFSLKIMSGPIGNLKYLPGFSSAVNYLGSSVVFGILIGAFFAFVLHSSAALIGFILVLAFESLIPLSSALPLVLGANLGTTFSTILASNTTNGRRVATGNLMFKIIMVLIIAPLLGVMEKFLGIIGGDVAREIANFHTIFNICTALLFLPLLEPSSRLLEKIITETKEEILRIKRLDPAFLSAPSIALGQAAKEILLMADITMKMLEESIKVFENRDIVLRKKIIETDDEVDKIEEMVTPYISQITRDEVDEEIIKIQQTLLCAVAELEHIGDIISKNLMNYAKKQIDSGLSFSEEGFIEIKEFHNFVLETLRMAVNSLATHDKRLAKKAGQRREIGLEYAKRYEANHLSRLSRGLKETIETSTIHLDIISDLERINFHASEIGRALL
uniref:PhoU domain-containing protein n=1 Tax=candidate division WOR-3 bacterium TaxID=2052148 RepID=A0A7C4TEH0_UNCW3